MLKLIIGQTELFDEESERFISLKPKTVLLMHSLLSISKWESVIKKPFLSESPKHQKTEGEIVFYIQCMCVGPELSEAEALSLLINHYEEIQAHINSVHTATVIKENRASAKNSSMVMTNELIYYKMFLHGIPLELEKWHINRLLTLIRIFDLYQSNEKLSKQEVNRRILSSRK